MYLKTVVIFLACLQFAVSETYDKVNLTYGYQTRCPYCLEFVEQQFYEGYKQISDYINMEVLPIISSARATGELTCNHGENECFISKAQACAFERPGMTEALRVEYLFCTEEPAIRGKEVLDSDIEACVNSSLKDVVTYETVKTCMNGVEFVPILQAYRDKAINVYGMEFVPWLGFFGVFDEGVEEDLRSDFVGTICSKLTSPPEVCNSSVSNVLNSL